MTSSTVGALVASRQPRNPLGWLFLLMSLCVVLGVMGEDYPMHAIRTNPGSLPGPEWVLWVSGWTFGIAGAAVPLIRPPVPVGNGAEPSLALRPLAPRRRDPVGARVVRGRTSRTGTDPWTQGPEPRGDRGDRGIASPIFAAGTIVALLSALACFVGLILRFRRSQGEERQQLRWLAYVGAFSLVTFIGLFVGDAPREAQVVENIFWSVFVASLMVGIPAACGIAIAEVPAVRARRRDRRRSSSPSSPGSSPSFTWAS